jgi:hypothetical protein
LGKHFAAPALCTPDQRQNIQRRTAMPVILLWAIPAVFVLGGVTYLVVK